MMIRGMTITPYEAPAGGLDFCAWVPGDGDVPFYHLPPGAPVPDQYDVVRALHYETLRLSVVLGALLADIDRVELYVAAPGLEADVAAALTKVNPS